MKITFQGELEDDFYRFLSPPFSPPALEEAI